ncbi:MAG: VWA domain-containing protein [Thiomonas sp.]|uniref:VWA domain-containing protein n=1 Tax=Thiomonas sp. TaxID=2047785 RepID=UPI002A369991|nr:VWA domain-containing protein [Thiomonas sp.]MDY0330208.1 VWA domain-containing protein [Thiomonas sp.]
MNTWEALWTQPWFWARPWAFALLAVPLLLAALRLWRARSGRARALAYADAALLPFATRLPSPQRRRRALAGDLLLWALLAAAAAGPRQPMSDGAAGGLHRIAVMVLIDADARAVAPSAAPITPLEQQRLLLAALWPQLRGERLGLIAYGAARPGGPAGAAQLLPPTDDPALFAHAALQARPEVFADAAASTALPGLLALARERLQQQADGERGAVLLLAGAGVPVSADFDASATGRALRHARLPLFVLALPGLPHESAALLRAVAQSSGGGFAAVAAGQTGPDSWNTVYAQGIARLPAGRADRLEKVTAWRELYGLFLLPALMLLFWRERPRRLPPAVALLGLALVLGLPLSPPAQAQQPPLVSRLDDLRAEHAAWQAWQHGDFARAQTLYAALPGYGARMGEGAAAYRLRQYQVAAQAFHRALLQADTAQQRFAAFYNLGDASLHQPGRTLEAVQAFDAALRIRPGDADALRNARLAQRQYEIEHPPDYLVGIAKRAPPIHHSRFGQQGSNTPSQLRHKPPPQASAPLQQAASLSPGGRLATAKGIASATAASWQPPVLDWAGASKRMQLLRDASGELLAQRAAIDTRAAAQEGGR